jgi:hypothetical protein
MTTFKTQIILWLLWGLCENITCQSYIPYVQEGKFWFYNTHSRADANPGSIGSFVHFFKGDTTINQKQYKRLYQSSLKGTHNCQFPPCFTPNIPYETELPIEIGYGREDIINKKVYFLSKEGTSESCSNSEYELYDFDIQVGDSISECHRKQIHPSNFQNIGKIDSIKTELVYGRERIVHYFQGVFNVGLPFLFPMRLIEGVGFDYYDPIHYTQNTFYTSFCEGTLEECNFLNGANNHNFSLGISIFPSPSNDIIWIKSDHPVEMVEIIDLNGKSQMTSNQNEITISNLSSGIYFASIYLKNGQTITQKIIKL